MKHSKPYLIRENDVSCNIGRLDEAWEGSPTFLYFSGKSGVPIDWLETKVGLIENEFSEGHFILLTSGSTGRPKLVVGHRRRAERLCGILHELQSSEPVKEAVCLLPLTYCYSFVNQWLWARQFGRSLIMTPGLSEPAEIRTALTHTRDAMLCLVGAQVPLLIRHFPSESFAGIIRVHFAGGRFPQENLSNIKRLFPNAEIYNNYGCAEAMPRLTIRPAKASPEASNIGKPLPGVELKSDEHSRILFRSVFGAVAMIDDTGLSRIANDTWVPTGDLGRPLEDGQWQILGRSNEVFKRYGEKVSIPQVLSTVRDHWDGQADCYRQADPQGEEGYVLVLSPIPINEEVRKLLRRVGGAFSRAHWPLRVEGVTKMPLLPNGKVDRQRLASNDNARIVWHQRL